MKKIILLGLIVIISIKCTNTASKNSKTITSLESILNEFGHQLQKDIEDDGINGSISAAIVKGNKIIWSNAYGTSDIDNNTIADSTTIYRIGSVSKSFTSFLMMQLVEEKIIELDDPIENYLPEIKELNGYSDSTKITFLQLASHTSGLQREPQLENATSGSIDEWENKVLQSIPKTAFQSKPGERYSYSNIGYGILGLALSRAAKKPFIELIKTKIFKPLNMNNSYFIVPDDKLEKLAKGMEGGPFGELNKQTPKKEHMGRGYKVPNGAIYSTPNDLAKFMISNMGYMELLNSENLALMQKPVIIPNEDWWDNYGLGLRLLRNNLMSTIGHTGSVSGYTANFMFDKERQYGVVIMINYNWGMTNVDLRAFALLKRLKKFDVE
ncbi:class A beta-lactamase-related serine hydrolase [Flavobacteriaceae bacterium AU392]|nr:class A beta-lactamase-related serine hydrolase [Flavobacteriaceae bacterium]RKM85861.1 class A beta-lactamase-related serine hydrolase [Flavobacteriaceae bacterium AU392]